MNRSRGYAASGVAHNAQTVGRVVLAVFVVLFMVGSSFFVMVAGAEDEPEIWTDKDEYRVGETVLISGHGFCQSAKSR